MAAKQSLALGLITLIACSWPVNLARAESIKPTGNDTLTVTFDMGPVKKFQYLPLGRYQHVL